MRRLPVLPIALLLLAAPAAAQDGTLVYRLGRDTVAVEQFTRTPTRFHGDMVTRGGAAVVRTQYVLTVANGRVTAATVRRTAADGSALPNTPLEYRFAFRGDSATRTLVFADSQVSRTFAAPNAFPALPIFVYAPLELLRARTPHDSVPSIALAGNGVGYLGIEAFRGDTVRLRGAPYAMSLVFDGRGGLIGLSGAYTTNKAIAQRTTGRIDMDALARRMRPTGVLSPRQVAQASITQAPIMISYGSPAVRGRTVWGGALIPMDSIWRTGANEATLLATSRPIQLGGLHVPAGLYSLWTQLTPSGAVLIVNSQTGQWGTQYDASHDLGRAPLELSPTDAFVEDLTITIRPLNGARGVIELAWGDRKASVGFQVLAR
ncbi:MAG: DUF2911 domain-containing protein [Gemmatimonadaceae bacterium]|nr:DUF2911 domain-containing protein [Gemmatimonadaceae bacterium]